MKRSLPIFACILFALISTAPPSHARGKKEDDTIVDTDTISDVNAREEAHKIRGLMKIALAPDAKPTSREVLSAEIAFVEKNKKLKDNVVQSLLNDDDPDPSMPAVKAVNYPDGTLRGLLFIQTENVKNNKPNRIAWPLNPKREQHEGN